MKRTAKPAPTKPSLLRSPNVQRALYGAAMLGTVVLPLLSGPKIPKSLGE